MEPMSVVFVLLFGVVAVIFLVECLEQLFAAARRWFTRGHRPLAQTFAAGFSLRRPDSVLRERHRRRDLSSGRLTEINKPKEDPYEP